MLLALDVGNTNVTVGAFQDDGLAARWRLRTVHEQTADEWGILLRNLFAHSAVKLEAVDGIVISSVVPPVDSVLADMAGRYFDRQPMFVTPETDTGLKVMYDSPKEVGADRIVNAVAAYDRLGGPCVVVDLGTAITFDAISDKAEYLGGLIYPGLGISIGALFHRTARLPKVDLREPARLIGTNSVASIQSGLYYGTIGTIDGILQRLIGALGPDTKVIGTGGQARLISGGSRLLRDVDEDLTLKGLKLIWERNREP